LTRSLYGLFQRIGPPIRGWVRRGLRGIRFVTVAARWIDSSNSPAGSPSALAHVLQTLIEPDPIELESIRSVLPEVVAHAQELEIIKLDLHNRALERLTDLRANLHAQGVERCDVLVTAARTGLDAAVRLAGEDSDRLAIASYCDSGSFAWCETARSCDSPTGPSP